MKNNLISAISNYRIMWYLEHISSREHLMETLKNDACPDWFVEKTLLLFDILQNDPDGFQILLLKYYESNINAMINNLSKTLLYIQKILEGKDYLFKSNVVKPTQLAKILLIQFDEKVYYKFSIGYYSISARMSYSEKNDPTCIVRIFRKSKRISYLSSSISTNWEGILPVKFKKLRLCFEALLNDVGVGFKINSGMSSDRLSFLGNIVSDKSKKAGKSVPTNFSKLFYREMFISKKEGDLAKLKKILKKEYNMQRQNILPFAMRILHFWGENAIKECKNYGRMLNKSESLIDKIYNNTVNGSFAISRVPEIDGITTNPETKIFTLAYRDGYQFKPILMTLAYAGWAGSTLIGSENFPSIMAILETGQSDYIMQTSLGHWHEKDLYEEEICKYLHDAEFYKGKIIYCLVENEKYAQNYSDHLQKERIKNLSCCKI